MAAPFATGSYEPDLYSVRYVPLTAEDRAEIIARWGEDTDTEGCEQARPDYLSRWGSCIFARWTLKSGSRPESFLSYLSLSQYVAINGAIVLATLVVTFLVLTAAMAAVRKWWRWVW